MPSLLLDEQISHVVSEQVALRRPDIPIQSILTWRAGTLLHQPDDLVLQAAADDGLTLVTYDQRTILPLSTAWYAAGRAHQGIVFIDERTIRSNDFGGLVRAIEQFWDQEREQVWTNRIDFLRAP
jgi:hypothetical protein